MNNAKESIERIAEADAKHEKRLRVFADDPFSFIDFIVNDYKTKVASKNEQSDGRSGGTNFESDTGFSGSGESRRVARS